MREGPNGGGLWRKAILSEIDQSLTRLGTDYVDLYQIHRWDYHTPIEETMEALNSSTLYREERIHADHEKLPCDRAWVVRVVHGTTERRRPMMPPSEQARKIHDALFPDTLGEGP